MQFPLPTLGAFKKGRVDFNDADYRALIAQKGLPLTWSQSSICPCSAETSSLNVEITNLDPQNVSAANTVACPVCRGAGKIFHSPQEIRGIISSAETDFLVARYGGYKDSVVNITVNPEHIPAAGDRYVIKDSVMLYNEVHKYTGGALTALTFPIVERDLTLATGDVTVGITYMVAATPPNYTTSATELLHGTNFTITVDGKIQWLIQPTVGTRLAISYYINPSYVAVSFPKTVRDSRSNRKATEDYQVPLPLNFQAKLEFLGD